MNGHRRSSPYALLLLSACAAQTAAAAAQALTDLSLEELMRVPVTLVAKRATPLARRCGARTP